MPYEVDDITRRLNEIVERYLTKNARGWFIESHPYARRESHVWPDKDIEEDDPHEWTLTWEKPPEYTSTKTLDIIYAPKEVEYRNGKEEEGFHMRGRYLGNNLETALIEYETLLKEEAKDFKR
ncbi:hypothetical protein HN419_07285 [Candidatus Woesearchaeota archaeon]|jgi:hypothetical protein|nr:hypothetical protein [Candidatus Woesearchaeota archaeon]MBT3538296.1 hypothetical protein [Candidatus Woesearchaeota archaeon]MBT4696710.1 hypothetical protein [Candidatus Woesearchaeota archaeon]MBT4716828.1 hypothetical protein [Candidatus Woesearchaeota archaeon]MBT7105965.1 hypothetical protein [Candidatus Woesearchaeota archaeon]